MLPLSCWHVAAELQTALHSPQLQTHQPAHQAACLGAQRTLLACTARHKQTCRATEVYPLALPRQAAALCNNVHATAASAQSAGQPGSNPPSGSMRRRVHSANQ